MEKLRRTEILKELYKLKDCKTIEDTKHKIDLLIEKI